MNLLCVLPGYPPVGGTYSMRITKLLKYVSCDESFDCTVLTPDYPEDAIQLDESLLKDVPESISVERVGFGTSTITNTLKLLSGAFRLSLDNDFDWVVSSSNNQRFIFLGYLISRLLRTRWHCDLVEPLRGGWKGLLREANLFALDRADLVTAAWPLDSIFPDELVRASNSYFLPHGFDPEDFTAKPEVSTSDGEIQFLHAGTLFREDRDPLPVLNTISELVKGTPELSRSSFTFNFIGPIDGDELAEDVKKWVSDNDMEETIQFKSFMNHREITGLMSTVDVLFGFHAQPLVPLKLFEYLGTHSSILAYYPEDSPCKEIFRGQQGIYWVDYQDREKFRKTIKQLITEKSTHPPREFVEDYNLRRIGGRLTELLKQHGK